jgi:hypothetical protein
LPQGLKNFLVFGTVFAGLGMMVFGFSTWMYDYAPVKWLSGIFMLCTVPLQICIIGTKPPKPEYGMIKSFAKEGLPYAK